MPKLLQGRTTIDLRPADVIGKGGEADIYVKDGNAYKIFKTPDHPDLQGFPADQAAAALRLREHQTKLPDFPTALPPGVIAPEELVRDGNREIAGYRMRFLADAEVLLRFGERSFRDQGIGDQQVVNI